MPAVHLDHLSFAHSSAVAVLDDVTAHLGTGWTAVVGPNGAGKTTLLRLISGDLRPSTGNLTHDPPEAAVVTVEQSVEHPADEVAGFAASWEATDASMRGRFGLDLPGFDRWSTLSPGERKRWQIAAALARDPDVLLLDEPTNHLDAEGRAVLVGALRRFEGVGLVVSHDRVLLEELTTRTLRIDRGAVTLWSGAYEVARGRVDRRARDRDRRLSGAAPRAAEARPPRGGPAPGHGDEEGPVQPAAAHLAPQRHRCSQRGHSATFPRGREVGS